MNQAEHAIENLYSNENLKDSGRLRFKDGSQLIFSSKDGAWIPFDPVSQNDKDDALFNIQFLGD